MAEAYRKQKMPATRLIGIEATELGRRRHYVYGLVQPDITQARKAIRRLRQSGTRVSFTAWLIYCLAAAAADSPEVNSIRKGRHLYTFEPVHVGMPVEAEFGGSRVPVPYLLRDCGSKSFMDLTAEIDEVRQEGSTGMVLGDRRAARLARLSLLLPAVLRRAAMRLLLRNPVRVHGMMGALGVTAVGMFGPSGGWPIVIPGGHTLVLAVGGIETRPAMVDPTTVEPHEFLDLTIAFDHDVIDGAPAARFTARLIELLEGAYGLDTV